MTPPSKSIFKLLGTAEKAADSPRKLPLLPGGQPVSSSSGFGKFDFAHSYPPDVLNIVQKDLARTTQQLRDAMAEFISLEIRYTQLETRFTQLEEIVDRGPWPFLHHKED